MGSGNATLVFALFAALIPMAYGDQGSFTNSGGSAAGGSGIGIGSNVATPAGTLSLNCPPSSAGTCAGGSLTYYSNDGTTSINASFTNGRYAESCAGGGKGGHVTCGYSFTGYFSGTLIVNGQAQGITGVTYQGFGTTGSAGASGTTVYNSAYAPFYYSDSEQIHRSDDLQGTNQISFGSQGSGVGQFYGAYGIALDSAGRIYIADTYNCRIVRIDDMNGTNWISYGGPCGSGQGQLYDPAGIALDAAGRIYAMDSGNCRVVRIDDMNGTNWVAYGAAGSSVGQFSQWLGSVAVDASARIYVADTGNTRLVRMDDMNGTNWTVLTQSTPVNGVSYSLQSPVAVALDSAGRIYVADNEYYQPAVVRVDDMTGANWTSIYTGTSGAANSIAVDSGGTVFLGGGGVKFVDGMAGVLTSSGTIGPIGSYYVFGIAPIHLPSPRPSAIGFSPATLTFSQNVGTSGSQPVTISNFGGGALNFSVSASGGFSETNSCTGQLPGGQSCTVSVTFAPSVTGPANGLLSVTDNSGNLGTAQAVTLTGLGTAPAASLSPASLSFSSQVLNTTGASKSVVLQNTGTGAMQIQGVTISAPFSQTNNCGTSLAPNASCTLQIAFTPSALGPAPGTLTVADDAGTQTASLTGTGVSPASFSPNGLEFGVVLAGATSTAQTVTLTNRGSSPLAVTSVGVTAGFAVGGNTCVTTLSVGANCTVSVAFSPTATGDVNGKLTFSDSAINSPQSISLQGAGSAPVTLSAGTLRFGTVVVGTTGAAKTVTLTNRQGASLSFTGIVASAGFAIAGNTCGASIAAGATCSVGVTFSPIATGAATGTLTFTDSARNSPQTVSLSGSGR